MRRHKYRCASCHGDLVTAPALPRIKPGSAYGDEMVMDVALTKYCDLVPVERYSSMAAREGLRGLPPQSLIEATHHLAEFVRPAYERLRDEILTERVLHADETPHRMLEGDKKSSWFLWGFSGARASYFECHPTRSGEVATKLLIDAQCEYLMSDVFSGYARAVRETSAARALAGRPGVANLYCNAHARRRFKDACDAYPAEAEVFLGHYDRIYALEREVRQVVRPPPGEEGAGDDDNVRRSLRERMRVEFIAMRERALGELGAHSSKSSLGRAMSYFLENFTGLTRFLDHPDHPIDNNPQERLLRNPVIGRKTWYGTHSKQGAKTAATLFSLVESCKLNRVNPRAYFRALVGDLHAGRPAATPAEFARASAAAPAPSTAAAPVPS